MSAINRRHFGTLLGSMAIADTTPALGKLLSSATLGERLYADVEHYAGLGDHRTASPADDGSTAWLSDRLRASGYKVETPKFILDTFVPDRCTLAIGGEAIEAFPAWPVVPTAGTSGSLLNAAASGRLNGAVALVVLPYRPGAAFAVRGYGSAVLDAQARGAAAIVVVTQGPTGAIIALNAHLERFAWTVPVILVAGRQSDQLSSLAAIGARATVTTRGIIQAKTTATNVLATRAALPGGSVGTLVLTTPKSGWFTCAGERGSGIAIFLAVADMLARTSRRKLVVVATSGHELEGLGGEALLENYAPPPGEVALWTHIGANVASNGVEFSNGLRRLDTIDPQRGILVPTDLIAAARTAFARQPGYSDPVDVLSDKAIGEVVIYRRDGYRNLVGLVGGHPLHHTRLDTATNATSPPALEPVARALMSFLASQTA